MMNSSVFKIIFRVSNNKKNHQNSIEINRVLMLAIFQVGPILPVQPILIHSGFVSQGCFEGIQVLVVVWSLIDILKELTQTRTVLGAPIWFKRTIKNPQI